MVSPSLGAAPRPTIWLAAIAVAIGAYWLGVITLEFLIYPQAGIAIYDDAFFFTRYAEMFLQSGVFAFNPGEAPVHGNTSQLYQMLVTLVYWLTGRDPVLTLLLCSVAGGWAAILAMVALYRAASGATGARWQWLIFCLIGAHLALSINFQFIALSGMETTWTIAVAAMALRALILLARAPRLSNVAASGLWQIAVYLARPDAAAVALAPLAALCLFGSVSIRPRAWRAAGIAGGGIGAAMAASWLYYGDPLPLAIFIKALPVSTLSEWDGATHEGTSSLISFLRGYGSLMVLAPLWAVIAWRRPGDLNLAIGAAFLAGVGFVILQWVLVIQIMGMWGRFYAPALPALAVPGLLGIELLLDWWRKSPRAALRAIALAALIAVFALPAAKRLFLRTGTSIAQAMWLAEHGIPSWNAGRQMFARLIENIGLPRALIEAFERNPRCSIASSEDGLLAAYFRHHRIVDLSGLHDRRQAHEGFSAAYVFTELKPDVLIFPDPWYGAWVAQLRADPALARDYQMVGVARNGELPVAVRRDSPCLGPIAAAFAAR